MMKIWFKSLIYIALALAFFISIERLYYHYTGAFSLANITYESTPFQPIASTSLITLEKETLSKILNQPFSFLGKGNQTYAFLSADGEYVLKFFKFGHLKNSWYQNLFRNGDPESRWKRFSKVFQGYQLAYEKNRKNSGLLFIHLNKTDDLGLYVQVRDRLGFSHRIALDSVVFVIQEKAIPAQELFTELLDKGNVEEVKTRLDQLMALYHSEYQQGLYDRDHNLIYNTGFTKTRAIRFDVGKLREDSRMKDPLFYEEDLKKIVQRRLNPWFRKHYPTYYLELEM